VDRITVTYDASKTTIERIAKRIHGLGYETEVVANPTAKTPASASEPWLAPVPKAAPKFFADAMKRAKQAGRPVVIDFTATWCTPCKKLKKNTMQHAKVAEVLAAMEVIHVDLDAHKELAESYGVKTVPDVFFIDRAGRVVDRLRKFETVEPFLKRLAKITGVPQPTPTPGPKPGPQPTPKSK